MAVPVMQRVIAVLWPSFFMAGAATIIFFAIFDPYELLAPTWFPNLSRLSAYSVGFFSVLGADRDYLPFDLLLPTAGRQLQHANPSPLSYG